ncbi:T9SS type A sorting domain-containing protein, partial [Candidatus Poribacteria bacterium]|nr:T9SS type A sorting domain-containing protein [Candidatus Poribacteria bacterium]
NELSSLPANVFSGLSALNWLSLSSNQLSSLPDNLFFGLSSLNSLYLGDNTVGLSITMSLEKVGGNQFKATAPTGAPFNIVLPVTVANGSIDGGATTITIAAGSTESGLLTVIPTPGTSDAVTVNIGTLPELPTSHFGYSLAKPSATDNTLSFALGIPKPTGDPKVNHAPIFTEGSSTTRSVAENTSAGTDIGSPVSATDEDEDILTYTLSGADAASFGIISTTGQLQTHAPLDYEKKNTYAVTVTVSDGSATDAISVTIDVTDVVENNDPVFVEGSATEREIPENTPAGRNIGGPVSATDLDEADVLTYSLSGADAASFGIVSTTGQLRTRAPLDYEKKNTYSVAVHVSDGNGGTDSIGVAINVTDVEENNAPVFVEGSATERSIPENTPAGRNIGAPVTATDEDEEDVLTYSLSGADAASFGIVSTTGQLRTRAPLDYEQKNVYSVAVLVSDGNGGTDSIGVAINVTDVNETPTAHAPEFIEGNATERAIAENTPAGRNIGAPVTATDEDEDVLTYSLSGVDAASFGIVSTTGQLRTRAPLDYEQKNAYSVAVIVSDGTLTDSIGVAINVTDVAENRAPVFASSSTTRSIPENTPAGRNIGSPITATDADGDTLTYALDGADASSFGIVSTTGQLKTSAPLDYEEKNAYAVTVIASDGTLTDTISVAIKITDIDENTPPVFAGGSSTTRTIPENTPAGVHIGEAVSAKDADDGDTLTYTLSGTDAAAFDIDSTTGQLKTKAALDYETKNSYSVTVRASDGILTDTIRVTIAITDVDEGSAPAFAGNRTTRFIKENTPAGVNIGTPVSATDDDEDTLTYTLGGLNAISFSIVSTTGQLKTKAPLDFEKKNAYTVTVTVSDGGRTDTITVAITIIDVDETPPTVEVSPRPAQGESVISISEIMFGSERRFTPPQWIELHNAGPDIINLTGWKLIIQNVDSPELTGPTTPVEPIVNATITFEDDFWGDAPRLWPNDVVLVVTDEDSENSKNLTEDQIYDLRWRTDLPVSLWGIILSTEGFHIQLIDDEGNLVDEAGNLEGNVQQWQLPYGQNRGRTRDERRTSMIRRYVDSIPLDGTQAGGWISAVDANLTEDQLTYYGDKSDISTPGIGIVINEISTQFLEYDVNQDGVVNISDLVLVAGRLGQSGPNAADVNGDGFVNVQDLILVAGALGDIQAAPALHPTSLEMFTAADVRGWLAQAHGLTLTDPKLQRGIRFLEQLLSVLVPKETQLLPNYPNPFNPETWIPYRLAKDAFVTVTIYDQGGRVVRRLDVGHQTAAVYESRSKAIYWDGRNEVGDKVASGIYFYTLTAGDISATRKMLILK